MTMDDHMQHMKLANDLFATGDASHVAVRSGSWSDPGTWQGGRVPGADAKVLIPEGLEVTYDVRSSAELDMVRVDGTLSWATDRSTAMSVETILTSHGSLLEIGTEKQAVGANAQAVITFTDGRIDLGADPHQLGHGLVAFGEVDIQGAAKQGFLEISGGAQRGDTSITVSGDTSNWKVGDTMLFVGTQYVGENGRGELQNQDEERQIVAINGNTITFDRALSHDHEAPRNVDADVYVANLSRNVVFESENPGGTRGHIMLHNGTPNGDDGSINNVRYAEFRDLGRTDHGREIGGSNIEGRYPIHLHQIGTDPDSPTSMIEGNSVHGGPGWGIVQHSSRAMVNDNVVSDITGAGIVSEWGDETGMWLRNLVTGVSGSNVDTSTGNEGAAYENQSRVIVQQDNIAANSKVGWNFNGRESHAIDDDLANRAPQDGLHRKMFEREQLQFDPSPFDLVIDHEEPAITEFNDNISIGVGEGFRVFHRQFADDTDTMSVIRNFLVWGGQDAVNLDNYASNYQFIDSVWQGSGTGFRIERKTSSVVFKNVEFIDFGTGYESFGINHEVVLIDTEFKNVRNEFSLKDLLRNVNDSGTANELISYFRQEHGIDYTNPMPKIVSSSSLTEKNEVRFVADRAADMSLSPDDFELKITGDIYDSVGQRTFNEYVIARPPSGNGFSKDFEGVELRFLGSPRDNMRDFTVDGFLEVNGTYQKNDGSWVSPVVNWITDRLTGITHPVIIEIELNGFDTARMRSFELDSYPAFKPDNADFDDGSPISWVGSGSHAHGSGDHTSTPPKTETPKTETPTTDKTSHDGGSTSDKTDGTSGGTKTAKPKTTETPTTEAPTTDASSGGGDGSSGVPQTAPPATDTAEPAEPADEPAEPQQQTGSNAPADSAEEDLFLDTVDDADFADWITAALDRDAAQTGGAEGDATFGEVKDLIWGSADIDRIMGDAGDNKLKGHDGDYYLDGLSGQDIVIGGVGWDVLVGGSGDDNLRGGDGSDLIIGGAGRDILIGGEWSPGGFTGDGATDLFVFRDISDSGPGAETHDIIRDFEVGIDLIDLTGIDAVAGGGDNDFRFVGEAGLSGTAGEVAVYVASNGALVRGDVTGNGEADFEIMLSDASSLTASDFLL